MRITSHRAGTLNAKNVRRLVRQMRSQQLRGSGLKRQGIIAAALRVSRCHGHRGDIRDEVKGRSGEAAQLAGPQAGLNGQPVEHGPFLTCHTVAFGAILGGLQQSPKFIGRKCTPVMATIQSNVELVQVADWAYRRPVVPHHPPPELLHCLRVEIEGLGADTTADAAVRLFVVEAKIVEKGHHFARGNVGPGFKLTPHNYASDTTYYQFHVP